MTTTTITTGTLTLATEPKRQELKVKKSEALKEALAEALVQEQNEETLNELPNGTVLRWKKQFTTKGPKYTYVALKINSSWYTTAQSNFESRKSASQLASELLNAKKIKIATVWEKFEI